MQGQALGSLIAAGFGLVYVVVNTGALPAGVQWPLRALALVAAVAVLLAVLRRRHRRPQTAPPDRPVFGRWYWWVVIIEVVALIGGVRVLAGPLDLPQAGVAWVSLVVGLHFFALAAVFSQRFFHVLGVAISLCGSGGMALVLADVTPVAVDVVAGVVPGGILLASGWWGARRRPE